MSRPIWRLKGPTRAEIVTLRAVVGDIRYCTVSGARMDATVPLGPLLVADPRSYQKLLPSREPTFPMLNLSIGQVV